MAHDPGWRDLPASFNSPDDLAAIIAREFPDAAPSDPSFTPRAGRAAALDTLARVDPPTYAATRNHLDGAVSGLSPHIRCGCVTLAEARDAALANVDDPADAAKFVQELAWRDYYQRVLDTQGDAVWRDIEPWKTGHDAADYATELPDEVAKARTGLACIDAFVRELIERGSMHNPARLWFASYLVHWRRVHWRAGARFFLQHLLDADLASNNLSWQWVASAFAAKPYIFNRENLERYTGGRFCASCPSADRCPFDDSYENLERRLFTITVERREPRRG